jgi:ABC-type phosphate/phosphonate transport system permease subunit
MDRIGTMLVAILAVAVVGMIAAAFVVVPMAYAQTSNTTYSFSQIQTNNCSGFAGCSNTGTITFGR